MTTLRQIEGLPDGFLAASATTLADVLPEPTLLHIEGRRQAPLFVSILLHGNEATGLHAIQSVLRRALPRGLPRSLCLFVGNVRAAAHGLRRLEDQPDFNRIWPGTELHDCAEVRMAAAVVDAVAARKPFASIDVHNNTGMNPHYGCVNRLDPAFLHLATLFSRTVVHFVRPLGVQSAAFAPLCPAVTVECGKVGNAAGDRHAADFVDAALHLEHFPEHAVRHQDVDVYRTVATVKVPDDTRIAFDAMPTPRTDAHVRFVAELERMNFRDVAAGTAIARVDANRAAPLAVYDDDGVDVFDRFFSSREGVLRTRAAVTPSMLTLDERVIRQDCLCYLMERIVLD